MGMGSVRMNTPAPVSVTEANFTQQSCCHTAVSVSGYLPNQPRMDMTNLDQLKLENCLDFWLHWHCLIEHRTLPLVFLHGCKIPGDQKESMDTPTDYLAKSWGWDRTQPLWASSAPTRRTPRRSRSSRGPSPWACCPCRPGRSCQGPSPRSRPARSRSGWPRPPAPAAAPAPSEDKNMWIGEISHHISYVPGRPAAVCGWGTGGQQSVGPVWRSAESSWCG